MTKEECIQGAIAQAFLKSVITRIMQGFKVGQTLLIEIKPFQRWIRYFDRIIEIRSFDSLPLDSIRSKTGFWPNLDNYQLLLSMLSKKMVTFLDHNNVKVVENIKSNARKSQLTASCINHFFVVKLRHNCLVCGSFSGLFATFLHFYSSNLYFMNCHSISVVHYLV